MAQATPVGPPSAPRNFKVVPGVESAIINWTAPAYSGPGTVAYHLFRNGMEVWSGLGTSLVDTGLSNGRTYAYQVTASNSIGWGVNSTSLSVTPRGPPSAPLSLMMTVTAGWNEIELIWHAPQNDGGAPITNYTIYRGTKAEELAFLVQVGNVSGYNDTAVSIGPTYYYKVNAINPFGEGANSSVKSAVIPADYPDPPENFRATVDDGKVKLTWEKPLHDHGSPIIGYKVYRRDGAYTGDPNSSALLLAEVGPDTFTYNDTNASAGAMYNYCVKATNAVGDGLGTVHIDVTIPENMTTLWLIGGAIGVAVIVAIAAALWMRRKK